MQAILLAINADLQSTDDVESVGTLSSHM